MTKCPRAVWTHASACVIATSLFGEAFAAPFADLAQRLPDGANAVIVVNAAGLYASPLGQREGWKAKYADAFEASPIILPPSAERCILGANLNLASLRPVWEAAAMQLSVDPTPEAIAQRRGGTTDLLAGVPAVWVGDKTCILRFGAQTFGLITPAGRQDAARWARRVHDGQSSALSPYLQQAVNYADTAGTHVVLAVDLADAFAEQTLRAQAANSDVLQGVAPDAAVKILASIQGIKFGVVAKERLTGRLQLDFAESAAALQSVAKPLILRIVAKAGAMLEELKDWSPVVEPKSIALQGELTSDGMRRVFSLLALDAGSIESSVQAAEASSAPAAGDEDKQRTARASLRYFKGISKYIEDIQRLQRANSLDQAVLWIENYARKIDRLPTRQVDPELVEYGKYVAQTLRSIVDQASGALDEYDSTSDAAVTDYRIGFLPTARTVNYGGYQTREYAPYGFAEVNSQATQEQMQQSQDAIYKAVQSAQQVLSQLVADHETARKNMSERYGLSF